MKDKKQVAEEVKNLITSFTDKHLSEEEKRICLHIWERLTNKRTLELTRVRPENWAAATIWSFCRANFKYEEGITLELVCSFFNNKKSTVGNRAGEISKMLKIDFLNPEFTTEALQKRNPLNKLRVNDEGFIIPKDDGPDSEKLNRYLRLRSAQQRVNHDLLDILPPGSIQECGLRLGLFHDKSFILGNQSEMDILMDHALYDYRWEGHNVIERYARQTSIEDGSDERIILDAMLKPRYSLFRVDEVKKGFGVGTHDLFRGDKGLIIDVAWSKTAVKDSVLACRVISPPEGFSMSTGAGLPVDREILRRITSEIPQRFGKTGGEIARMSPEKAAEFSTSILRILLEEDAASYMKYEEVIPQKLYTHLDVGRNDPCPCGSGKKYKKCCGR